MAKTGYVRAKHAFGVMYDGEQITVAEGEIVPVGHPLLKGRAEHFEPVENWGRFDNLKTSKAPGKDRGEKPAAKQAAKPAETKGK